MKSIYKSHEIQVNTQPNGQIVYDVYNRSRQHLLAGFSQQNIGERAVFDMMKQRVDQLLTEAPVGFHSRMA